MMADLGFMGMIDPKYGGSGLDSISYVLAMTEIAKLMRLRQDYVCKQLTSLCWDEILFRRTKNEISCASG
jgi:hypothetical protein